jgi:hypothetical protein
VYQQPNPEAWDDQPADQAAADQPSSSADGGAGNEPVEYVSGDASGSEEPSSPSEGSGPAPGVEGARGNGVASQPSTTPTAPGAGDPDDGSAFLADLARAMQAAAGAERARSLEETEHRRETSIAEIRTNAGVEAGDLEQQAETEITEIGTWADAQMERIREERERRIAGRREQLARRLDDHRLITDRQVEAIEEAVSGYRAQLDAFFKRLDGEQDPGSIARLARTRPQFPALELIAGRARTAATADTLGDESDTGSGGPLVGVMDPSAEGTSGEQPWASPAAAPSEQAEGPDAASSGAETSEEPTPAGAGGRGTGALLGTVPALRPIGSWLHRERNTEDAADRE